MTLRLPLVAHKFMAAEGALSKEAFFGKWKAFTGEWGVAGRVVAGVQARDCLGGGYLPAGMPGWLPGCPACLRG